MTTIQELWISKHQSEQSVPHGLQIAIDTISYGQNIPLRVLDLQNLENLPEVIKDLITSIEGKKLLQSEIKELAGCDEAAYVLKTQFLYSKSVWDKGSEWVISIAKEQNLNSQTNPAFDGLSADDFALWKHAMLELLPHLERKVWLTSMGNPLPGHVISRMVAHWALYILCWTYQEQLQKRSFRISFNTNSTNSNRSKSEEIAKVFGIKNYTLRVSHALQLNINGHDKEYALVTGPFWQKDKPHGNTNSEFNGQQSNISPAIATTHVNRHQTFINTFNRFIVQASIEDKWSDAYSKSPLDQEIADGFTSRLDFAEEEAALRADSAYIAITKLLLPAQLPCECEVSVENASALMLSDEISRANWETIATLCCWLARWDVLLKRIFHDVFPSQTPLLLTLEGHRIILQLTLRSGEFGDFEWYLEFRFTTAFTPISNFSELNDFLKKCEAGVFIDDPEMFFNRLRERQNAAWTAQIVAVNNLLNRQTPKSQNRYSSQDASANSAGNHELGRDDLRINEALPKMGANIDEVGHLLRGYAGRICQHLLGMIRADVADIYWLDYSQSPPRMVSAGGYAIDLAHRNARAAVHKNFDEWSWAEYESLNAHAKPARQHQNSPSQAYRVAAHQKAERVPCDEHCERTAYFDAYPVPKPKAGLGVPLLINGRTVGVLTFAGLHAKQFDDRILIPLRRAAQLIAQTLYQASLLWHMRQLNCLVTHTALFKWKQHNAANQFNPLKKVSECLSNVFLCRAVHLWLQAAANDSRYVLHGYNHTAIFQCPFKPNDSDVFSCTPLNEAPKFEYDELNPTAFATDMLSTTRAYACFVLDQPLTDLALGSFTVASYKKSSLTTKYTTAQAEKGMWLHDDFLQLNEVGFEINAPNIVESYTHAGYRESIFKTHGLHDMLACVLLQKNNSINGGKTDPYRAIGVLTLHDIAYEASQVNQNDDLNIPPQPWSTAWAPIVAHVQTYLPYLFQQVSLLNDPVENMRRFLLHSVRSELIPVRENIRYLNNQGYEALSPNGVLQRRLRQLGIMSYKDGTQDEQGNIYSVQQHLQRTWEACLQLANKAPEYKIQRLIVLIEKHNELALMGTVPELEEEAFNLQENLQAALDAHESKFHGNLVPQFVGFPSRPIGLRFEKMWWDQLIANLVENAAKYARERYKIQFQHSTKALIFANIGVYDPETDKKEHLVGVGNRGSAAKNENIKGLGLGLWGVSMICDLLNIKFEFEINPQSATLANEQPLAEYRFILTLPNRGFN